MTYLNLNFIGELLGGLGKSLLNGTVQGVAMTAGGHVTRRAIKVVETRFGIEEKDTKKNEVQEEVGQMGVGLSLSGDNEPAPKPRKTKAESKKNGLVDAFNSIKDAVNEGLNQ